MKKENQLVKFTTLVLLITIVAISLVSGTYAKYTSTVSGSDTAIVAKWDVSAENVSSTTVDIFAESKIYDTNGVVDGDVTALTATDDADVKNAEEGNNGIIAPGTWGKFSYVLSNNSDVNATYAVDYTVANAGVPLKWSIDGKTWADDLADVEATNINMADADKTVDIYWMWAFDGDDTALGTAGTAAPSITIEVTFEQVD